MIKRAILAALLLASTASPALAGHFENGYRAYNARDYVKAREEWAAGDADGDIESTYELSIMYRDGEGMKPDEAKAFALTLKAALAGYSTAQFNMASYYRRGMGTKVDGAEARRWFKVAGDGFNNKAMHGYATALYEGFGGPKDKAGAIEWYERAKIYESRNTYYDALIDSGKLPRPDYKARFEAALKAAQAGDNDAQFKLALMYMGGQGTERDYKEMERWMLAAANAGHSMAQLRMGNIYRDGIGRERNRDQANIWFRKAAINNNAFGQALLGLGYFTGMVGARDKPLALALMILASAGGDEEARGLRVRLGLEMTDADIEKAHTIVADCRARGLANCLPALPPPGTKAPPPATPGNTI